MLRIFDNMDASSSLKDALRQSLPNSHQLDACVGYFNLRGWGLLAESVDAMSDPPPGSPSPRVRLLLGMADPPQLEVEKLLKKDHDAPGMDNSTANRLKKETLADLRNQLTLGLPSSADQTALRHLTHSLQEKRACARLFLRHRLHAKLYLCHQDDPDNPMTGFVGSSNLTMAGLAKEGELNVDVLDHDAVTKLHTWFENLWYDQYSLPITQDLLEALKESWAGERLLRPYLIYLKLAYHLSREAREGLVEYGLPQSMAEEEEYLLPYQRVAVRIAARILNRRGGVMVGDVAGLGKTMIAVAIALLLQEETGSATLIVCPKNLVSMWQGYVDEYELHARVLSQSLVKDLHKIPCYPVVVIDESHNLRNPARQDYKKLQDYIRGNGSKVILLTATPYNKQFSDVVAQLGLFVDPDADLGIRPERHIMKTGEVEFLSQCNDKPQTLGAFQRSEEAEDYRRLMSLFLVRRTRRFIEKNYGESLTYPDGKPFFPRRVPRPLRHEVPPDSPTAAMMSDRTLEFIDRLSLPRYTLAEFLDPQAALTEDEEKIMERWRNASGNLIGITRTRLYKRLSSSGAVFRMSLERHLSRDRVYLHAIQRGLPLPIGHYDNQQSEDEDNQQLEDEEAKWPGEPDAATQSTSEWELAAAAAYQAIEAKASSTVNWVRPDLFTDGLAEKLKQDCAILEELLNFLGEWRQKKDSKLDALQKLLEDTHPQDKVLVFTEYRDTAEYVACSLRQRGVDSVEAVSGSSDDPTAAARRFSPAANLPFGDLPADAEEIRVLIATDVLSEGQNLQDSHIVVNFDLPWAIVKIIQRAGRVDRYGQKSGEVLVYSFLPAEGVEAVISLRERIASRLKASADVFGSDESFFDEHEPRFLEGLYDENSRLDWEEEEPDKEVDWTSHAYEIWRHAEEHYPELAKEAEALPDGKYATMAAPPDREAGVLVCVEKSYGLTALAFTNLEREPRLLDPYQALQIAQCEPGDNATPPPIPTHHSLVAAAVTGPLRSPVARQEGSLTGIRGRCWKRLRNHRDEYPDSPYLDTLDKALDELYRKPLLEEAASRLTKTWREKTPKDLAQLIIDLHQTGTLCLPEDKLDEGEVRLLCSMGFAS